MKTNETGLERYLDGFLIGSFLGTLAGVLFAPKSGKEQRSDLKEMGSDTIDKIPIERKIRRLYSGVV